MNIAVARTWLAGEGYQLEFEERQSTRAGRAVPCTYVYARAGATRLLLGPYSRFAGYGLPRFARTFHAAFRAEYPVQDTEQKGVLVP